MAQQRERPRRRRTPDLASLASREFREFLGQLREDAGLAWNLMWDPHVQCGPKLFPLAGWLYVILPGDWFPGVPLDDLAALRLTFDEFFERVDPVILEEHRTRRRHARQLRQAAETRRREKMWRARR